MNIKTITILFALILTTSSSFSQADTRNNLVDALREECPLIFKGQVCDAASVELLSQKFNAAEIWLMAQLARMTVVDSSSFYQRKKKELDSLEQVTPVSAKDSLILRNRKEQLYLLTSVLRPSKSAGPFASLLYSYLDAAPMVAFKIQHASFFYYRIWLYELIDNRFGKQWDDFGVNKAKLYYNRAISDSTLPFKSIAEERKLVEEVITWYKKTAPRDQTRDSFQQGIATVYVFGAKRVVDEYNKTASDSLFSYIEELYLKALEIDSVHFTINYNLGVFYYNRGVMLMQSLDAEWSMEKINAVTEEAGQWMLKGKTYMDRGKYKKKKKKK